MIGFDLDVLLHRLQSLVVPHWSRVGHLKLDRYLSPSICCELFNTLPECLAYKSAQGKEIRCKFNKLSARLQRVDCFVTLTSPREYENPLQTRFGHSSILQELLRSQKNYKLSTLARTQLSAEKVDVDEDSIFQYLTTANKLFKLCEIGVNDAFLALSLALKINVLPLTKQLTELGGNIWCDPNSSLWLWFAYPFDWLLQESLADRSQS